MELKFDEVEDESHPKGVLRELSEHKVVHVIYMVWPNTDNYIISHVKRILV